MRSFQKSIRRVLFLAAMLLCLGNQLVQPSCAQQLEVATSLGSSIVLAGQRQILPLRVSMRGFRLSSEQQRAAVNMAIVIDRSGSMGGEKLQRAKDAASMAIERLHPDDIVSLITYDDVVEVIVPSTKVSNRQQILRAIRAVQPRGGTALFAGVSQGGSEVQKFIDKTKVNRIILISDGLANVGPSSPGELADLGASYARQGISVSTIGLGLGYNEDLMVQLAGRSDGNHFFVENSNDLIQVFQRELGDILSVIAKDIEINISCAEGFRPVRVLGLNAQIHGQLVRIPLSQLYAAQEKYVVLELEAPSGNAGEAKNAANVSIRYTNLSSQRVDELQRSTTLAYSDSLELANRSVDRLTMETYYTQLTLDSNTRAIALRDANRKSEAQALLLSNAQLLNEKAQQYSIPELNRQARDYQGQAAQMDNDTWSRQRKGLTEYNYKAQKQIK